MRAGWGRCLSYRISKLWRIRKPSSLVYIYYRSEAAKPGTVDREDCAPSHLRCSNSVPEGTSFSGARSPAPAPNGAQAPFLRNVAPSASRLSPRTAPAPGGGGGARSAGGVGVTGIALRGRDRGGGFSPFAPIGAQARYARTPRQPHPAWRYPFEIRVMG